MSKGQKGKVGATTAAGRAAAAASSAHAATFNGASTSTAKGKQRQGHGVAGGQSNPSSSSSSSQHRNKGDLPDDDLMASIRGHDEAFTALLSLIPAELYVAREEEEEEEGEDGGSDAELAPGEIASQLRNVKAEQKRKRGKQTQAEMEAAAAEKKAHLQKAKRAKLDPDNFKTPIELQQERALQRAERLEAKSKQSSLNENKSNILDNFGMAAGDTDADSDSSAAHDDTSVPDSTDTPPTSAKASDLAAPTGERKDSPADMARPMQPPSGALDLRARLQAKIQAMQASRRAAAGAVDSRDGSIDDDDDVSTASTRDELLEERRRKRGEMRDRRRQAAKERKRAERDGMQQSAQGGNAAKGGAAQAGPRSGNTRAPELLVRQPADRTDSTSSRGHAVEKGDVTFSTLQFDDDAHSKKRANKHALPSDPKAALAVLEARKRKEEARQEKAQIHAEAGPSKGQDKDAADAAIDTLKERADRERWSKAEAAAQGVKIRDDTDLLRKSVKKRDKIKEKSTQAWKERARNLEQEQAARQKKRTDNIAARKERTKLKHQGKGSGGKGKGIGGKKMGGGGKGKGSFKARPGFEGRRSLPSGSGAGAKRGGGGGKPRK